MPGQDLPPLHHAVRATREHGYAYVPRALDQHQCQRLVSSIPDSLAEPVEEVVGEVRQHARELALPVDGLDNLELNRLLAAFDKALPATVAFTPTELTYMFYKGPHAGISPHRDPARHKMLIAIFTLKGRATFRVHGTRSESDITAEWTTSPGDLMFLRAPELHPHIKARPFHSIGPPIGSEERISLSLRMKSSP
ncbi:MAG: hypothetical protein ACRDZO_09695 [Egibacteraceae bacterium]